jgi:hypothetical protein
MKETPLMLKTPLVKATLEGRKTQTRRVMRDQPSENEKFKYYCQLKNGDWGALFEWKTSEGEIFHNHYKCPYGKPGDLLWVKETYTDGGNLTSGVGYIYKANNYPDDFIKAIKWKPSLFMPKSACRLWLEIESITPERLCDISEEDAIAEGVSRDVWTENGISTNFEPDSELDYIKGFKILWDSINGKTLPWSKNPWLWAIKYKVVER